jgi:hypothetical protein
MLLNESLDFSSAPLHVKQAFLGAPEKLCLNPGTKLYKWTDYPLFGPHGVTEWWGFVIQRTLPSGLVAEGFRTTEKLAARVGTSHQNYQLARMAVSEKFNNKMEHLLVTELILGCWAFAGKTKGQQEFKDPTLSNVYLIGGKCQLWIPNLGHSHIRQIPAVP